ncbi:TIM barrel protein [Nitrosarchaeum sp.]|uniref:TIM barrel protein n=1 Tax=Nitrosarchaeum sp. TaxID=2026886 RepID=UPI00247C7CCB|nr:TIM barrel protein [Nitrosarchaeum sp.]MCV0411928.1 sugar phosphate isomerase/epimerase [Nitrosarchaeum sp.]
MILGMKVRKPDLNDMLKFNPRYLEFHFSDSDLKLELDGKFNQNLIVHCYEYFERKLLDIVSLKETNQIHSKEKTLELIQMAIDKTISLGEQFQGVPSIIVHPGGYSLYESKQEDISMMQGMIIDSVKQLDFKNINFLLENMPPYAWFFGGRWYSNVFLSAEDMYNYCKDTGLKVCYDLCHSHLYCNKNNLSVVDELLKIGKYVEHFHISDAADVDGEGLQFGEGDLPFEKVIPILNGFENKSFAIEVWKGHERGGKGFEEFLDKVRIAGLIVS